MSIHRLIRQGRERLGLSEEAFGKLVGVSRSAVQQWEKEDGTAPNRSRQQAVAEALGISISELMGSEPPAEWPFALLQPDHLKRLSPKDLRTVEKLAFSLLEEAETPKETNVSSRTVKDEFGESEDVTWTLPPYKREGRPSGKRVPNPSEAPPKRRGGAL